MRRVIVFDGECNFCNAYINKLISVDKERRYFFTPYSSDLAQNLLKQHNLPSDYKESFILSIGEKHFTKSSAVIQILLGLGSYWKVLGILAKLTPKFMRNFIYDYIARNRYRISKRYNSCRIPTPDMMSRFL